MPNECLASALLKKKAVTEFKKYLKFDFVFLVEELNHPDIRTHYTSLHISVLTHFRLIQTAQTNANKHVDYWI